MVQSSVEDGNWLERERDSDQVKLQGDGRVKGKDVHARLEEAGGANRLWQHSSWSGFCPLVERGTLMPARCCQGTRPGLCGLQSPSVT